MEELVSMIVANGLWAALFCILLGYELRDSRKRESRYTQTINALSDRLGTVKEVKTAVEEIKTDVGEIKTDAAQLLAVCSRRKSGKGSGVCAEASA